MSIVGGQKRKSFKRVICARCRKPTARKPRVDSVFSCVWCRKTVTCYHPRWLKPSWYEGYHNGRQAFWCSRKCGEDMGILPK